MPTISELFNLAVQHHQNGDLAQAEQLYRQVIEAYPKHADSLHLLGVLNQQTGHNQEAIDFIGRAITLVPDVSVFHNNLGLIQVMQGLLQEAATSFRQALHLDPNHAEAHNGLGLVLVAQNNLAEGAACFRQALNINPDNVNAHFNLGNVQRNQGQFAEAAGSYDQVLRLCPGHGKALWNRACLRLRQGDFAGGWPDFEHRWALPGNTIRSFKQPRWDGAFLEGKTILVYAELGLGDTIQFCRYLPFVQQRGGVVVFECQPALLRLVEGIRGVDKLVPSGAPLPSFDVQIPLLSLPGIFRTTLANIPAENSYLVADPESTRRWGQELQRAVLENPHHSLAPASRQSQLAIGIAWQGNTQTPGYLLKSMPLNNFEALARVSRIQLVSLQVGARAEEIALAPFPITDLGSRFDPTSLDDLAGTMMNLDLVVTADTAVAHLAGALGVQVWVALPFVACWRWLLERTDSPWYPRMRLFRQCRPGDWCEVFERMAAEIRQW